MRTSACAAVLVLEQYRTLLREDVELFTYIQYLFFRQWRLCGPISTEG